MTELTRNDPVVFHFRVRKDNGLLEARGGATIVFDPKAERFGASVCSLEDVYSKKMGRQIATGRARSKNSFLQMEKGSEVPTSMEMIRGLAAELAHDEAESVVGRRVVQSWKRMAAGYVKRT